MIKAGLTLNDLYDTTGMTHNRFSDFHWVYTIMQVVHTKFIKVFHTEYSVFRNSSKNFVFYETLLVELRLEDKYNYKIPFRNSFENFE